MTKIKVSDKPFRVNVKNTAKIQQELNECAMLYDLPKVTAEHVQAMAEEAEALLDSVHVSPQLRQGALFSFCDVAKGKRKYREVMYCEMTRSRSSWYLTAIAVQFPKCDHLMKSINHRRLQLLPDQAKNAMHRTRNQFDIGERSQDGTAMLHYTADVVLTRK